MIFSLHLSPAVWGPLRVLRCQPFSLARRPRECCRVHFYRYTSRCEELVLTVRKLSLFYALAIAKQVYGNCQTCVRQLSNMCTAIAIHVYGSCRTSYEPKFSHHHNGFLQLLRRGSYIGDFPRQSIAKQSIPVQSICTPRLPYHSKWQKKMTIGSLKRGSIRPRESPLHIPHLHHTYISLGS